MYRESMKGFVLCSVLSATSWASCDAFAADQEFEPHDKIQSAVAGFIENEYKDEPNIEVSVKAMDPRLRLRACDSALQSFWPQGNRRSGNVTVGVRCEGEKPWKIFAQANISIMREVVVLNRPVSRGESLAMSMIRHEQRDVGRIGQRYVEDAKKLLGYRFRQGVTAGRPLHPRMLEAPLFVERGESVRILSNTGSVNVSVKGRALADGGKGETINVKNISSGRILPVEVMERGVVKALY